MTRRMGACSGGWLRAGLAVVACASLLAIAAGQDAGVPPPQPSAAPEAAPPVAAPVTLWERRGALDATDAAAYFELGEDFAELARTAGGESSKRALGEARRLFVLSARIALSRRASADSRLASSAMLALASLADSAEEARWLRGVAESVAPAARSVKWEPSPRVLAAGTGAYEVAAGMGAYRSGEFRKVRDMLRRQPEALALLTRAGVDEKQARTILTELESDSAKATGCPRCRGERIIKGARSPEDGRQVVELCPVCLGNPAPSPAMTPERFGMQLRAEALLLGASPTTWSAQAKIDGAAPLRDVDPGAVAAHYGVDLEATVFRNGAWVKP